MLVWVAWSPLGPYVLLSLSACLYLFLSLFLSFSVSVWSVVWVTACYVVVTNPPAPLAGSQCAGLFSTTVLGGSSSAPNLQDYARAHRKKFSTGSLSYKDGTCLRPCSFTNLHRATADQCLTHFLSPENIKSCKFDITSRALWGKLALEPIK